MPQPTMLARPSGTIAPMNLQAVRSEIDRIDRALLDLMEQRLATSRAVAGLKQDEGNALLLLRPDREADVLRRMASRAEHMPGAAIGVIWRELMALNLQTQKRTEIALHAAQQPVLVTDETRRRFGCAAPIVVTASAEDALDRARGREAIAVIEISPLSSWWVGLFHDETVAIFDCLRENGRISALAVGRVARDSLPAGLAFPIISEARLRRRTAEGEAIRPLAICGHLRLCISEASPPSPRDTE